MPVTGWIVASAPDEGSSIDSYWAGNGFVANIAQSQFFSSAATTVDAVRVEEGNLQIRFSSVDVRLTAATQSVSIAADNESAGGWIYASAPDENSPVDGYFDGAGFVADIDSANFLSKAEGATIQSARLDEGRYQSRFSDVDVRILPADAAISVV